VNSTVFKFKKNKFVVLVCHVIKLKTKSVLEMLYSCSIERECMIS